MRHSTKQAGLFVTGGSLLVAHRHDAEFPLRCIFTNKPVESLTKVSLYEVTQRKGMPRQLKKENFLEFELPLHDSYLDRRQGLNRLLGRAILLAGIVGVLVVAWQFSLGDDRSEDITGLGMMFGIICTLVGGFWGKLRATPFKSSEVSASFINPDGSVSDEIGFTGVHQDFIRSILVDVEAFENEMAKNAGIGAVALFFIAIAFGGLSVWKLFNDQTDDILVDIMCGLGLFGSTLFFAFGVVLLRQSKQGSTGS